MLRNYLLVGVVAARRSSPSVITSSRNILPRGARDCGCCGGFGGQPLSSSSYALSGRQRQAVQLLRHGGKEDGDEATEKSIEDALKAMEEDVARQEEQRVPTPFHELLRHSARATWRSSPQPPPDSLSKVRSDLIKRSGKTGRQLRRTNERIVASHTALAERRERERRELVNARYRRVRPDSLEHKRRAGLDAGIKPVSYGPEQTMASLRYRLVPNYFITRRVLNEARSLLGKENMVPRRIIDAGCGIGSASAAALDLFGADNVEWVHAVDPSRSMRDGCVAVLQGIIDAETEENDAEGEDDETDEHLDQRRERRRRTRRKATARNTRITVGETMSEGAVSGAKQRTSNSTGSGTGSFDLALCTYTASELPHIASGMTMAAILWEKLAPNGALVMIEPGTPDGFSSVRAVRNMLLDCCPPDDRHAYKESADYDDEGNYGWRRDGDEECHIIAPCTHAHSCPMERHQKHHLAKKRGWTEDEGGKVDELDGSINADDGIVDEELSDGVDLTGGDEHLSASPDVSDESHPDWDDDEDNDVDRDYDDDVDSIVNETSSNTDSSTSKTPTAETDMFERAFCSFVHAMPGGDSRSKGEKFSYLVVQKRITGAKPSELDLDRASNPFHGANLVDLLASSISAGKEAVDEKRKKKHMRTVGDAEQHSETIQRAADLEDKYIDSDVDNLALELVRGDIARGSFGRIVRAPVKRRGHIMVDYCAGAPERTADDIASSTSVGNSGADDGSMDIERKGRIIRHRVSRRVSARVAPGMYGAARKARWGGLWPNISDCFVGSSGGNVCEDVSQELDAVDLRADGVSNGYLEK